jgi:NADPH:quinone reductase-like Zn-dependent oxidoreductase
MKAIVQDRYGAPDVLRLGDVEAPAIAADEVLVRVLAAGAHVGDWHLMAGSPYLVRVMGYGLLAPKRRVPGSDLAGIVSEVGTDVERFAPGDAVFGFGVGAFAEFARAREAKLATKPAALSFEEAAVMPVSGSTALQALRLGGRLQAGQHVLILGAGGGVGTFAVQLAKAAGAVVTGVCSTAKVELVRSLGADRVIDYTRADVLDDDARYDRIVDAAGNRPLRSLARLLTIRGTLAIVGGEGGGRWLGPVPRLLGAPLVGALVRRDVRGLMATERSEDLRELATFIEAGALRPVVGRRYRLAETADALRYLGAGRAHGKVVIRVPEAAA